MKTLRVLACTVLTLLFTLSHAQAQETGTLKPDTTNRVPPGQREISDFPILRIGGIPDLDRQSWSLEITGDVENPCRLDWDRFAAFEAVETVTGFHCVTGWTRLDNRWKGVRIRDVLAAARPKPEAKYITFQSADGYYTSLDVSECTGDHDILAFEWEGESLTKDRGGPVRVMIPGKYGYKSAMWLTELKLTREREEGYWEKRGYSETADPWTEDRLKDEKN